MARGEEGAQEPLLLPHDGDETAREPGRLEVAPVTAAWRPLDLARGDGADPQGLAECRNRLLRPISKSSPEVTSGDFFVRRT